MIEAILLSSMLNFSQTKEKPYTPNEERKEFRIEKYGLREEDVLIKPYFFKFGDSDFEKEYSKSLKINIRKGGKNGRFK